MSIQLSIDHLVGINVMKKIIKFINIITFSFYCTFTEYASPSNSFIPLQSQLTQDDWQNWHFALLSSKLNPSNNTREKTPTER